MKRLTKGSDSVIYGVCSGISEYIGIDSVFTRVAVAILGFYNPLPVLFTYFVLAVVMPSK